MEGVNFEALDVSDAEILNAPEPAPEPAAEPEAKAETPAPIVETAERARDPETGKFVAQAPATAPDPVKAAEPKEEAPKEQPKVIPLASHIEARRQWEQQLAERDKRLAEINDRLKALEPQQKPVDFIEDPKGYVDQQTQKTQEEVKRLQAEAENLRNQQQLSHFVQTVAEHEAGFVQKNPDYYDALNYAREVKVFQYTEMYPEATPEQIREAVAREELQTAHVLLQQGRNPADVAYKLAQKLGYRKPEPKVEAPKINVPKAPVADPGQSLGSAGGGDVDTEANELDTDDMGIFTAALKERFGARR